MTDSDAGGPTPEERLHTREVGEWLLKLLGGSVEARFDDQADYTVADELFQRLQGLEPKPRSVMLLQLVYGAARAGIAVPDMATLKVLPRTLVRLDDQ